MLLELTDLVVLDHFSVLKTKIAVVFGGLRVDWLEHSHGLESVEFFFGKFHHFHLVNQVLVHLVQFVF